MGGHPYYYFVKHQTDVQAALDALREREFKAGRYNPVLPFLEFGEPAFSQQTPGAKHKSIKAALAASAEDGTRSILDISKVGARPDYGVAAPLTAAELVELYGTDKPTRKMVEDGHGLFDLVDRGQCRYVVCYDGGQPSEIFFVGYSYD